MKTINIQILETIIIAIGYVALHLIVKTVINNFLKKTHLERSRRKMAIKSVQLFTTITAIILLTGVWGFRQNEIALFASTILTALGIAFFAKWSLLSNITSSILIFFNHPVKLGDWIKILSKDDHCEGEVIEMNYFFVHIKTSQQETITIPNSHFFEKSFSIVDKSIENQQPV